MTDRLYVTMPTADSVSIFWCGSEDCGFPHIILHDEAGKAYAQFCLPDGFAAKLQRAENYSKALRAKNAKATRAPTLVINNGDSNG